MSISRAVRSPNVVRMVGGSADPWKECCCAGTVATTWRQRMDESARRSELKQFLKAKRALIAPESIGLPRGTRRSTSGLRREEVAALAGVGLTWYTWLEQGRPIHPSHDLIRRIGVALHLSPADQAYLFKLSGLQHPQLPPADWHAEPSLMRLLDTYPAPAFVIDDIFNMLASNRLANQLYGLDEGEVQKAPEFQRNHLWQIFMNPARRALYVDFEQDVHKIVALFRLSAALHIGEPRYERLVAALLECSPDFLAFWEERETAPPSPITIRMRHPVFGNLQVHSVRLPVEGSLATMIVFVVPADDRTRQAFTRSSSKNALST